MKKVLSSILFLVLIGIVQSCGSKGANPVNPNVDAVANLLTSVSGWTVVEARFGSEDAPSNMYNGYRISFNKDGNYTINRPNPAAVNPNRGNPNNFGAWRSEGSSSVIRAVVIDNTVNMNVLNTPSTNQLELEWVVNIPGKETVVYYWKLRAI